MIFKARSRKITLNRGAVVLLLVCVMHAEYQTALAHTRALSALGEILIISMLIVQLLPVKTPFARALTLIFAKIILFPKWNDFLSTANARNSSHLFALSRASEYYCNALYALIRGCGAQYFILYALRAPFAV
jgi:hypothetical protein